MEQLMLIDWLEKDRKKTELRNVQIKQLTDFLAYYQSYSVNHAATETLKLCPSFLLINGDILCWCRYPEMPLKCSLCVFKSMKTVQSTSRKRRSRQGGNGSTSCHSRVATQTTRWTSSGEDVTAATQDTMLYGEKRRKAGALAIFIAPGTITALTTTMRTKGDCQIFLLYFAYVTRQKTSSKRAGRRMYKRM